MLKIDILSYRDNYIYVGVLGRNAFVVDPSHAATVQTYLTENDLNLTLILNTHHHLDHTAGNPDLIMKYKPQVIAAGFDTCDFDGVTINVIPTPGHTNDSVCFFIDVQFSVAEPLLFTGDTLFVGGCGRIFEGSAVDMFDSFQKIRSLPLDTFIYVGHEYTEENYAFAAAVDPVNPVYKERQFATHMMRTQDKPSVPAILAEQCETNIFFHATDLQEFAGLRMKKDRF